MKTYAKGDWVVRLLGIGVVAGGILTATTYLRIERERQASEALGNTIEHLYQDHTISTALRRLHEGDIAGAAGKLDALLCEDILHLKTDLNSADDLSRSYIIHGLRRITRVRPASPGVPPA